MKFEGVRVRVWVYGFQWMGMVVSVMVRVRVVMVEWVLQGMAVCSGFLFGYESRPHGPPDSQERIRRFGL
jgi:hypothetical protein